MEYITGIKNIGADTMVRLPLRGKTNSTQEFNYTM